MLVGPHFLKELNAENLEKGASTKARCLEKGCHKCHDTKELPELISSDFTMFMVEMHEFYITLHFFRWAVHKKR